MPAVEASQVERISAVVKGYDAQGWHRTGTPVDAESARWLAAEVRDAGLEAMLEDYSLDRFVVGEAYVESGGRREAGLPIFDSALSGRLELDGKAGALGSGSDIGVSVLDSPAAIEAYETSRRRDGHKAEVVVNIGRSPGLMARNANDFTQPFGLPVLQLSSEARTWAEGVAAASGSARLVIDSKREAAQSANVVAVLKGSDSSQAPMVVTTPRSGWWQCASERGGGIAAWLEVMRAVKANGAGRDVWFVAYSGHELGSLGCHAFLKAHPDMIKDVKVWVHFGANVGGASEAAVRVSASQAADLDLAKGALDSNGVKDVLGPPPGVVMGQESQVVHNLGARSIALLGGNAFFHIESDRWPVAVDPASIGRQGNAIAELVLALDRA